MSRGNTHQRIQDVALELFAERGYEKTSLREIAERLEVTKAALYYHFKTKEDILVSIVDDFNQPVVELIEWGREQPRTLETKKEILRRYSEALSRAQPLFRFIQENQASLRDLSLGERLKKRMFTLSALLVEEDADLVDRVRATTSLFTMHAAIVAMHDSGDAPEDRRQAALTVAYELITSAHHGD
ncbi:TetR/AcrR family transcriptional regulator [Streptomyces armeniacus]|uniref:TetR/AcrR family transcriptional regulator n=1 Tax=Streptomyces armeniacus TaxID=83291 RepID=A0A345XWW5_9ACTN|nr:TetR/AcrR family transcriptional regulator [Streptomyces armeniacus]AXK36131.1 TetR/AcrR family transcriptional regulator [Streptomyces armeniacus]